MLINAVNENHEIHPLLQQLRTSHFGSLYKSFAGKLTFKQVFQWLYEFSDMTAFKFYEIDPVESPHFEQKNVIEVLDGEVQRVYMIPNGDFKRIWDIEHLNSTKVCSRTFLICDSDGKLSKESQNYIKEMNSLADELNHRLEKLVAIGKGHIDVISLSEAERLEIEAFVKLADALFSNPVPRMKVPMGLIEDQIGHLR